MRVPAELALEQIPGEHHSILLLRAEQTAERRSRARQRPEIAGNRYAAHLLRIPRGDHRGLLGTVRSYARV